MLSSSDMREKDIKLCTKLFFISSADGRSRQLQVDRSPCFLNLKGMCRLLVGEGAWQWALKRGLPAAESLKDLESWNVTKAAQKQWRRYKEMIDREQPSWKIAKETDAELLQPPKKRRKSVPGMQLLNL